MADQRVSRSPAFEESSSNAPTKLGTGEKQETEAMDTIEKDTANAGPTVTVTGGLVDYSSSENDSDGESESSKAFSTSSEIDETSEEEVEGALKGVKNHTEIAALYAGTGPRDDEDEEDGALSKPHIPKSANEILPNELPPVDNLSLLQLRDIDHLIQMGTVQGQIDGFLVIEALPSVPALDVDSVLWFSDRHPVGKVFETFGPVQKPNYSIRIPFGGFERVGRDNDADGEEVKPGMKIFYAPTNRDFTLYVLVSQIAMIKGSDASWEHDEEPPAEVLDYSDDEEERMAKQRLKFVKRKQKQQGQRPPAMAKEPGVPSQPPQSSASGPPVVAPLKEEQSPNPAAAATKNREPESGGEKKDMADAMLYM
eukprot:Clim_evm5s42 gene=Clim_evmTU5s42